MRFSELPEGRLIAKSKDVDVLALAIALSLRVSPKEIREFYFLPATGGECSCRVISLHPFKKSSLMPQMTCFGVAEYLIEQSLSRRGRCTARYSPPEEKDGVVKGWSIRAADLASGQALAVAMAEWLG